MTATSHDTASDSAPAWLLDLGALRVAIAPPELVAVIRRPVLNPSAEPHSPFPYLVEWQGRTLAVLDLAARIKGEGDPLTAAFLAVVLYPDAVTGRPECGAIPLTEPPLSIAVQADSAAPLPEPAGVWRGCALSCFLHDGRAVPILDLAALFAEAAVPVGRPFTI